MSLGTLVEHLPYKEYYVNKDLLNILEMGLGPFLILLGSSNIVVGSLNIVGGP